MTFSVRVRIPIPSLTLVLLGPIFRVEEYFFCVGLGNCIWSQNDCVSRPKKSHAKLVS